MKLSDQLAALSGASQSPTVPEWLVTQWFSEAKRLEDIEEDTKKTQEKRIGGFSEGTKWTSH